MCYDEKEAREIVANLNGKILMVGHITCFSPGLKKAKSLIGKDGLGKIKSMTFSRTHMGPIYPGVDVFREVGCHDVSIALWLKGELPVTVNACGADILGHKNIDYGCINLIWKDGVIANILTGWCWAERKREIGICCENGHIRYEMNTQNENLQFLDTARDLDEFRIKDNHRYSNKNVACLNYQVDPAEPLKEQIAEFIGCIRENRHPLANAKFGGEVVKIVSAAFLSAINNGNPQSL